MRFDKEKLRQIAIEMTTLYALKSKTNYNVNMEEDIYNLIKNKES